jgi:o-succinylbenzoate synthase
MRSMYFKAYSLPLKTTYRWAKGTHHYRSGLLVQMDMDGHFGWGEAAPEPFLPVNGRDYEKQAEALIEDLDVSADDFIERLDQRKPEARLRCGISTAWLSARAASMRMPLSEFLAKDGRQPADYVPVNGLVVDDSVDGALAQARTIANAGMKTIKIKCFDNLMMDLERVGAIRRAFPSIKLRLDPNESWTLEVALQHLKAMSQFDIEYVEDPLPEGVPLAAMSDLRKKSPIKVAWDAPTHDYKSMQNMIEAEAADVFILKLPRIGGPDRLYDMVVLAERHDIQCTVTTSLETAIGTVAALHCSSLLSPPIPDCGLGISHFLEKDVGSVPPIENGKRQVPKTSGLGLSGVVF